MADRVDGRHDLDRFARAADDSAVRAELVEHLRAQLEDGRRRAQGRLKSGGGGQAAARAYAQAADDVLIPLHDLADQVLFPPRGAPKDQRSALLAVGGYGRGVLAPFSDLDLLFLRPTRGAERTEQVIQFVLYVLWDLGLKVGWAARTLDETLKLARQDMTIRTTLLEARPLAGDARLSAHLLTRFRRDVRRLDPRPFIEAKLEERDLRHRKAGATRYRVEPHVKDGKGGLRDLNSLFWIAEHLAPESELGRAAMDDVLTGRERRAFDQAFEFLWTVRIHMHLVAGRPEERLSFDLQPEVARTMGWSARGSEAAVERFMRRYFVVARDVGALTRALCVKLEERGQKSAGGLERLLRRAGRPRARRLDDPGFVAVGGRLSVAGPEVFRERPVRLLTIFREADRLDLDLHPDALAAAARSMGLITPALRRDPAAARAFLDVLAGGGRPYRVLSLMNEIGVLGRFLPEFARVVGQTQFNMYHAFTVDEHTLRAIGVLNDIERGLLKDDHPLATRLIHRLSDREALFLAMLLHDVGKGGSRGQLEDGAIAARRACERLGLPPDRAELVAWLVRHHLILSDYAQKRDVSDPDTIEAFVREVGDPERLRLLLCLTVADIRAVGPGVWNGWKGQLMRDLYAAVEARFQGGPHIKAAFASSDAPDLDPHAPPTVETALRRDLEATELILSAPDRTGLFADVTRALAAAGADVVGARLETSEAGRASEIIYIQDATGAPFGQGHPPQLRLLVRQLKKALAGGAAPPAPSHGLPSRRRAAFEVAPSVMIDNEATGAATIVEVSGPDRPGLLAELAAALASLGLSIRSAHVESLGERAVDAFYVTQTDGAKLSDPDLLARLRLSLTEVLRREPEPAARPAVRARASRAR
ncbi:[protein-PII] uridylyltransferase [Brevundimonas sp. 2R-24]|uniref:Bifunctional uridylyltransferase/uridylyl-removing enzyme n=1 Tax=Peiella sedimenti TaxID=3061083 RepID=A0ABT8SKG1_9CAUL|nr:[protein-PII] uridylyltransferase [Caulobacteraceae bacterium XZ-24]